MPKRYNQEIRDVCGALRHEGVMPSEIVRRLNEDEAGLGFTVPIKERRVYEYISDYNAEQGPPPDGNEGDQTTDSIARLKRRAVALLQREITALEQKRPGKLSVQDSVALKQHFRTLDDMEKREAQAEQRKSSTRSKPSSPSSHDNGSGEAESPWDRLAREQAEALVESPA